MRSSQTHTEAQPTVEGKDKQKRNLICEPTGKTEALHFHNPLEGVPPSATVDSARRTL